MIKVLIPTILTVIGGVILQAALKQKHNLAPNRWQILFGTAALTFAVALYLFFAAGVSVLKEGPEMIHKVGAPPKTLMVCDSLTRCDTLQGPNGLTILSCHRIRGK